MPLLFSSNFAKVIFITCPPLMIIIIATTITAQTGSIVYSYSIINTFVRKKYYIPRVVSCRVVSYRIVSYVNLDKLNYNPEIFDLIY
jgi:hypothetical protein